MAPTQASTEAPPAAAAGGGPMVARVNELKRAIQANPKDLPAVTELAHLYHDAEMWTDAIPVYEKAVALAPEDPNLTTDLGVCLQAANQLDRALAAFRRAQEISPQHWQSLYNIVVVAGFGLGRFDEAEEALDRLEKVNPAAPNLARLREGLAKAKRESRVSGSGVERVIRRLLWILTLLGIATLVRSLLRQPRGVRAPAPASGPRFEGAMVRDRICGTFLPRSRAMALRLDDQEHFFCSERCREGFLAGRRASR